MSRLGGRNHTVSDLALEVAADAIILIVIVVTAIPVGLHRLRSRRRPTTSADRAPQPATAEQAA